MCYKMYVLAIKKFNINPKSLFMNMISLSFPLHINCLLTSYPMVNIVFAYVQEVDDTHHYLIRLSHEVSILVTSFLLWCFWIIILT